MKLWHFSDTHGNHGLLSVPENIDIAICSGDCSNYRDLMRNEQEVRDFITWFSSLPIKYKIYVAGNHDTSIEAGYLTKDNFEQAGIIYLENESITIDGKKIYGSPHTPNFHDWAFMIRRDRLYNVWQLIPDDTDILVVHGPPKGVLDLAYGEHLEFCGCAALRKRVETVRPSYVMFGHIHNNEDIINAGYLVRDDITYSNGTVVTDGKFGYVTSFGNVFDI